MKEQQLVMLAQQARTRAYAPYSRFTVGAALLAESGEIYCGCNIENASFGATNCAERTAFFKAVEAGERRFSAIAIAGGKQGEEDVFCPPCGMCRQVMGEFCTKDFVILLKAGDEIKRYTLGQLLPLAFSSESMEETP